MKTKLKRTLSLVMMIIFVFSLFPYIYTEAATSDGELVYGVYYKIDGDHAVVTGCSDTATEITVRSKYNNYPVTQIADSAFKNKTSLKKVTIANSVTNIGNSAFYECSGLTSITIPDRVTSIGDYTFDGCCGLTSITIPDRVTSIGKAAFLYCSNLSSITIPDRVTSIGEYAFYGCTGLTSITIPDSVTSIGDRAFRNCTGLTSVTIPDSVTSIGSSAFDSCENVSYFSAPMRFLTKDFLSQFSQLLTVKIADGCKTIEKNAFSEITNIKSIIIPCSVTSIGDYAFFRCTGLTSITIPDSVTSIGRSAFDGCTGLTSITIPDSVTSIGSHAFSGCTGLASVTIPDRVPSIAAAAFMDCKGLTSITIPDSVTSIGDNAFRGCTGLTSITIPDSVTSIGNSAFYGCTGLTSITIPDSVTSIKWSAFDGCTGLASVTIPNGVPNIAAAAFRDCKGLTGITIPDSVTSIGNYAFYGCTGLTSITIPDSVTSIGEYAFDGCTGLSSSITIPDGVTSIGDRAFRNCTGLTSITIPDSVTSIGDCAFSGCTGLTSITIPDSVTSIGWSAFSGCTGLTSIAIPDGVTIIGDCAFGWCSGLTSITIPDSVTSIDSSAFESCENVSYFSAPMRFLTEDFLSQFSQSLTVKIADGCKTIEKNAFSEITNIKSIIIPCSVTSIGEYAFSGCTRLTSITIPDSVTSIGYAAFFRCTGLTSITIPASVTSIGDSAFYESSGLTSITIPDSVTSIGNFAFSGCAGLTSITIPNSVTSIGDSAFDGCTGLTSINIPNRVISIDIAAFRGCKGLTSINIPDSVIWIEKSAFDGCTGLASVTIPNRVTSIAAAAFRNCKGLTSITIPDSVTSIGDSAFDGCTGLASVTIPNRVTSIGNAAFSGCTGLTSIIIPDSVTSIGNSAFYGCTGLTSITIPDSVTSIGDSAFSGCKNLTVKAIDGSYAAEYARKNKIPLYLFSKTPESPIIKEYEYDKENGYLIITVDADIYEPFEYSTDCATWQKYPVLKVKINPDGKYNVYQRVAATPDYNESFPSKPVTVELSPSPTIVYTTETSVILNALDGFEYKMDNGEWQDSNIFDNLPVNSAHDFYQRAKASGNLPAGPSSLPLSVTTAKHEHTAVGGWQTDANGHYKLCSCGQEFDSGKHSGGEATCVAKAVCEVCGASYGEVNASNHKNIYITRKKDATCCEKGYTGDGFCRDCKKIVISGTEISATGNHVDVDGKWEFDENGHFHTCYFGTEFDREKHSGGEATCVAKAVCEICGASYGDVNANNHKNTHVVGQKDATCCEKGYTGDVFCDDCQTTISVGTEIPATGNHVDADGKWEYDKNGHFHTCCFGTEFDRENHKGGEATCAAKAVCEVCGASYGEKNANNHKNIVLKNNVAPTCKDPGYSGDKVCEDCGTVVEAGHEIAATGIHASASGEWKSDKYGHFRICDGCQIELDRENHKGGEATCSSLAVCEICGTSYGEKNLTNHKNTEIRGKVSATCSKEGYSGDTYCLDCGEKIVSGKTLDKLKHSYKDEVVPPTFGKQGYTLHTCTLCGDTYKDNYTFYVPSETDPLIAVSSVRGSIGKQVKVVVSLKNNPGIVSMLLRLNYDENVLKLINVEDCGILGEYLYNPSLGAPYYLSWVNDTATENFTENGNIVILTFEILEDAPLGKTPISVSYDYDNFDIYDVNGEEVAFTTQNGTVDVANVLLGDVNGDGIVNNYDRLLLTRWLAKWPEALGKGIIEAAADVNCDGKVNNLDRLILTRHLAHWAEYATLPYAG